MPAVPAVTVVTAARVPLPVVGAAAAGIKGVDASTMHMERHERGIHAV
jgi:hypothetical protein